MENPGSARASKSVSMRVAVNEAASACDPVERRKPYGTMRRMLPSPPVGENVIT